MSEPATLTTEVTPGPTPLALYLQTELPELILRMHAGALTPQAFSPLRAEIEAVVNGAGLFDLGYRARIRVTGADRLRWLNGMASNAIQSLPVGQGNYNFILNAQGRIQGDAYIYRRQDDLAIDTDRSQAARLVAHLDHFIIMDDVELSSLDDAAIGIGLAGPNSAVLLDKLLSDIHPEASSLAPLQMAETTLAGKAVTVVRAYSVLWPRFEIWSNPENALSIWTAVVTAGSTPVGIDAVEALRVLEGTPSYGTDITDRTLPQEAAQARALDFAKGCYLGQEIVERIRSRATVHRAVRHFALRGELPATPAELRAAGEDPAASAVVGQLTSVAKIDLPQFQGMVAIGVVRTEAVERKSAIAYDGGTATVLDRPPLI